MLQITVIGTPAAQGSKRFLGVKGGKGIMVESSKAVKPWRQAVVYAAREAIISTFPPGGQWGGQRQACIGPVGLEVIFTVLKPKSAPKRRRSYPDRKPDLSKLVRATEDALTDAGAWEDDARVIDLRAMKVFPGEHPDALDVPGAVIRIRSVSEVTMCLKTP